MDARILLSTVATPPQVFLAADFYASAIDGAALRSLKTAGLRRFLRIYSVCRTFYPFCQSELVRII